MTERDDFKDVNFDEVPDDDGGVASIRPVEEPERYNIEVGVPMNASLWFNNVHRYKELPSAKRGVRKALIIAAKQKNLVLGPVKWHEYDPLDEGVPPPPDWMQGEIKLLLGEAKVVAITDRTKEVRRFSREVDLADLMKLRAVTKQQYKMKHPHSPDLTDEQADAIIDEAAPQVAEKQIVKKIHNA